MPNLWICYAVISALALTGYNLAFRLAGNIPVLMFLAIANGVGLLIYAISLLFNKSQMAIVPDGKTLVLAVIVGLMIAASEIALFLMMKSSENGLSIGIPLMNIVSLLVTALVGWLAFREQLSWQGGLGIAFGLISVWLLTYKSS